eukprot:303581_1
MHTIWAQTVLGIPLTRITYITHRTYKLEVGLWSESSVVCCEVGSLSSHYSGGVPDLHWETVNPSGDRVCEGTGPLGDGSSMVGGEGSLAVSSLVTSEMAS